jgi:hypothetical protein
MMEGLMPKKENPKKFLERNVKMNIWANIDLHKLASPALRPKPALKL